MRQIPKSSEQYLRRGSRRTRNPWNLPGTHQSFDISGCSKKATTWALAPPYSVQMQAKVSLQVPSPSQRTRTPPLRAVYFGEGRKLISTKGYASALKMVEGRCQHVQDQIDASSSKYIWQDDEDKDFAVDAENPNSCHSRYANDSLYAPQWNAELICDGDQVCLVAI